VPPTGYLSVSGIRSAMHHAAATYPNLCQLVDLPEQSHEGRTIKALRIAGAAGEGRRGVLFLGGVHARELVNPDTLVSLALRLCQAYDDGTGLTFGGRSYDAETIKLIVDALDVFMIPLVNPDGRRHVQRAGGDPWWRKNRNPNPGLPCQGVDLNRNFDFLWSSGIGTSTSACSDVFRGAGAFSEPETRNVRHLLDTDPGIGFMIDVHSYSELILHPWGDDDNQTTDPEMNFLNPAFDGLRGNPGDSVYREYIAEADRDWYVTAGQAMRDAIAAVRGRTYTLQQSVLLYPTSGTSKDYAYSRHFVDTGKRRVYAYTLETAREFQPPYSEALQVIDETSSGLVQFCLSALCAVEETAKGTALESRLDAMRDFRAAQILRRRTGRRVDELLRRHSSELTRIVGDGQVRERSLEVLERVLDLVEGGRATQSKVLEPALLRGANELAGRIAKDGSDDLREAVAEVRAEIAGAKGKSLLEALGPVERTRRRRKPGSASEGPG
jgi:carboxypeptidase T